MILVLVLKMNCVPESIVSSIIAAKNLPAKRDFFKEIGSNPLLRDRALVISWQNPWKILADFPLPVAVGDRDSASCSVWLPQHNALISILSDKEYMENTWRNLCFIKELIKADEAQKVA